MRACLAKACVLFVHHSQRLPLVPGQALRIWLFLGCPIKKSEAQSGSTNRPSYLRNILSFNVFLIIRRALAGLLSILTQILPLRMMSAVKKRNFD